METSPVNSKEVAGAVRLRCGLFFWRHIVPPPMVRRENHLCGFAPRFELRFALRELIGIIPIDVIAPFDFIARAHWRALRSASSAPFLTGLGWGRRSSRLMPSASR